MPAVDWLRASPRRAWLTTFLLFATIATCWNLAQPPFAAIDEPNHVIKSLAVARGEWTSDPVPADEAPPDEVFNKGWATFDVPGVYRDGADSAACYRGQPRVTPECQAFEGTSEDVPVLEPDSRYPPAYYLTVGLVERAWHAGPGAMTLMRLATSLVAAALVASAVVSLLRLRWAPVALVGLAVAATPMAFHMASSVNPTGPEVAAGIGLWASGAVLAREAAQRIDRRVVARVAVAAAVLCLCRPLSPLFAAVIGAFLLALFTGDGLRRLVRDRAAWVGAGVIGAAAAFQLGWTVLVKPNYFGRPIPPEVPETEIFRAIMHKAPDLYRQSVGVFGNPDMYAPEPALLLWALLLGALAIAALAAGRRRWVLVIGLLLAATIAIPIVADWMQARALSFPWQARYTLPIAVGLPLLCATSVAAGPDGALFRRRRLLVTLGLGVAIAQALSFLMFLQRYVVGIDQGFLYWTKERWHPPLPSLLLTVVALAAIAGWALWLFGWSRAEVAGPEEGEGAGPQEGSEENRRRNAVMAPRDTAVAGSYEPSG